MRAVRVSDVHPLFSIANPYEMYKTYNSQLSRYIYQFKKLAVTDTTDEGVVCVNVGDFVFRVLPETKEDIDVTDTLDGSRCKCNWFSRFLCRKSCCFKQGN